MQKYLVDLPKPGDTVVFYDAATARFASTARATSSPFWLTASMCMPTARSFLDAYKGGYDVRDREMSRIFNAAIDKGIHLTAIFDSCHSGGISRGIGPRYIERTLAYDPRDIGEAPEVLPSGDPNRRPRAHRQSSAGVLRAQQDQTAKEMPLRQGRRAAWGLYRALIEALQAMPASTPASLIYQRVKAVLEGGSVPDQEPDLDASAARRQQPLFGGKAGDSGKILTAALQSGDDGVILDIGRVSGVGVGSEFTAISPTAKAKRQIAYY